ncbi:MAG: ribonuclease HII, partial [Flavobacteriaceae bacterium]|nr:ribonuclease HII [Flavobacteriaceae bacterium]
MLALKLQSGRIECGTDEAGRGCLAGPVTAAAVVLPDDFKHPFLTDSKQLSEKKRWILRDIIKKEAISYAYTHVSREEIDQLNILNASIVGMHRSIAALD